VCGIGLWAQLPAPGAASGSQAELYADRFESEEDRVRASGRVVLLYDGTLFMADHAEYDRKANVILLKGKVEILSSEGRKILSDTVRFDVGKERVEFREFYQTDRDDIWLYARKALKEKEQYTLSNSMASSCSPRNPDWVVTFSRADYNATSKYMELHGVRLYAKKVPLLYLPYLGFSLERQRHSGFLVPHLGLNGDEGFYYEQPFFWAISPSMDLQLNPAYRTERGWGGYGTFRFADSPVSGGTIRAGYFRDEESFVQDHDLAHSEHYGVELLYTSGDLLGSRKPEGYRDGLYVNISFFNDIDYLNLQAEPLEHLEELSRFRESRLNYFLASDRDYWGLSARYFIDTASRDNNETIQILPAFQYHRYAASLGEGFFEAMDYQFDARVYNYWREDGVRALRGIASLPVEFHTSLFDEYLNLTVREELAASDTKFFEEGSLAIDRNHYAAAVLHHNLELSSDLIRAYGWGTHTMELSVLFSKTTLLAEGDLSYEEISDELIDDYSLDMIYDSMVALKMHHFFEGAAGEFHGDYLAEADYYPDNDSRWNLLRQELHLGYGPYRFDSRLDYSVYHHTLAQFSNAFSYAGERYGIRLEHTRIRSGLYDSIEEDWEEALEQNELSLDLRYRPNETFTWYGSYTYDFKEEGSKDWKVGMIVDRKCWNLSVVFEQIRTPVLTREGSGSIRENKVYFQFNLIPFGGMGSRLKAPI